MENNFGDLQNTVQNLTRTVRQLSSDSGDHEAAIGRLDGSMQRVTGKVRDLEPVVEASQDRLSELEGIEDEVKDVRRQVRQVGTIVEWLERRERRAGGAEALTLEPDQKVRDLATIAEEGRATEAALLTPDMRRTCEADIQRCETARTMRAQRLQQALAASAELVDARYGSPTHTTAMTTFTNEHNMYRHAGMVLRQALGPSASARIKLADDATRRLTATRTIDAGRKAKAELVTRLRTQLAEAVNRGAILPTWFTSALGPMPPRGRHEQWMDTAVDLLTYRATYRVADLVGALGPESDASWGSYRATWRERLEFDLDRLQ